MFEKLFISLLFFGVSIFTFSEFDGGLYPYGHYESDLNSIFYDTEFEDDFAWCFEHRPSLNISEPKVRFCYTTAWVEYCEISWSSSCPGRNDEYSKCMQSCSFASGQIRNDRSFIDKIIGNEGEFLNCFEICGDEDV